jgi:hypothetical protein
MQPNAIANGVPKKTESLLHNLNETANNSPPQLCITIIIKNVHFRMIAVQLDILQNRFFLVIFNPKNIVINPRLRLEINILNTHTYSSQLKVGSKVKTLLQMLQNPQIAADTGLILDFSPACNQEKS